MEKIEVQQISRAAAAQALRAAGLADPAKRATAESIAAAGECFELKDGVSTGVFVLEKQGAVMWISGAGAVASAGLTAPGLAIIKAMAAQAGCGSVGFQTGRPGLVKLAKKQGYKVVGFIMEKTV